MIRVKAFYLLDAIYVGMFAMINHEIEQSKRLIERDSIFAGLTSDSIHYITLQSKQLRKHSGDDGGFTIFDKPEYDAPGLMQHGGKIVSPVEIVNS
jgi:hypothetical protein